MSSYSQREFVLRALKKLDWDMTSSLRLAMLKCSPTFPRSCLTTEFLLCGLYLQNRECAVSHILPEDQYRRMVEELCGTEAIQSENGDETILTASQDPISASVTLDDGLVEILYRAAKLSSEAGRIEISVADFMISLASQQDVLDKLFRDRGLRFKLPG